MACRALWKNRKPQQAEQGQQAYINHSRRPGHPDPRQTDTPTTKHAALPHANQPIRQSIRQPCPTPTSHPDYKEHHVIDTTK